MPAPLKPIIYIAFSNDLQNPGRNLTSLGQEQSNIEAAIRDNPGATPQQDRLQALLQSWDLIAKDDLTPRSLTQPFYSNRVAIFHYGGHAGPEALLLETEDGKNVVGSAEAIIPFLRDQTSLKLIFLNACSTKQWALTLTQNAGDDFCIIATSCPVQDPVAMQFAHDFYNCLASDGTIQEAFDKAIHGANVNLTGATRDFGVQEHTTNGLPWALYPPGPSAAKSWRLSTALKDPLLGVPPLSADYRIPPRPYVSIRGHDKEDAQIFFGRNAEVREIYDWATHDTTTPVMLFYGQSGSGKSSLLRAGVWPRLEARASIGYFRREEDLTDDLNLGLSSTTHIADPEQAATAWLHSDKPIVILLDQVEEVITHSSAAKDPKGANPVSVELTRFFNRIVNIFIDPQTGQPRLPGTKARLILSFRKEYLAEIRNPIIERIPSLVRDFWLDRLSEQNIIDIVEGPVLSDALRAQYKIALEAKTDQNKSFADYLVGRLYDPLSPVATILELELNRLWDLWHPTDPDKIAALQDPNGVFQQELQACRAQKDTLDRDQTDATLCYSRKIYDLVASGDALQQFVDDQVRTIDDPALNQGLELDLLYEHTSSLSTSQRRSLSELRALYKGRISDADLDRLLVHNKDLKLLADVGDDDAPPSAGTASTQIASQDTATVLSHDTLAPVIRREFYLSHNPGQRARRVLEDRARGWENKAKGDLLDAADLSTVTQGLPHMRATSPAEDRLIHASKRRHQRNVTVTVLALILMAVAGGAAAWWHEWQIGTSMRLASNATASVPDNYDLALLLSAAAYQFQSTSEARDAIIAVYGARPDAMAFLYPRKNAFGEPFFSPDGSRVLVTDSNMVELWDVATHQPLWAVSNGDPDDIAMDVAAFGRDGKQFAIAIGGKVQIWRTEDHQVLGPPLAGSMENLTQLAFSGDGKFLAAIGNCDEIQVWSLSINPPAPLRNLAAADAACHAPEVDSIAFDPADSGILAAWSSTGRIWLENPQTGVQITQARPPGGDFTGNRGLAFSANGARMGATTLSGQIDLFNVVNHTYIGRIDAGQPLTFFSFSQDGSKLAAATNDGSIGVWDTDTQFLVKPLSDGGSALDHYTAFSPDLKTAAVKMKDGTVLLLDISRSWSPVPLAPPDAEDSVLSIAASPDGKWIATGTVDQHIDLWNASTRTRVWTYNGQLADQQRFPVPVWNLTFTPDSETLLFPREGSVNLPQVALHRLNVAAKSLLPDLVGTRNGQEIFITGIAAAADGRVAAISDQGVIHLWDSSGKPSTMTDFIGGAASPAGLAFTRDGRWLATEGNDISTIALLDPAAQRPSPHYLRGGNRFDIGTLAFAPGSNGTSGLLAAGGSYGFWLWNLANGQQTIGGDENTQRLAFSPDGDLVVLGMENGKIELWDVIAGKLVGSPLQGANQQMSNSPGGVAFSPDGKRIFAGGWKGSFRVWDWGPMPLGDLAHHEADWPALACSIANRNLTRSEWKRYVGSFPPYRPVCPKLPVPQS